MDQMPVHDEDLSRLVEQISSGDRAALQALASEAYVELRRLAHRQLARGHNETLNTTSLVNEWYVRMAEAGGVSLQDRRHFFVLAARIMRQILCAYSRERMTAKRGGGARALPIDEVEESQLEQAELEQAERFVEVDDALERLAAVEPRLAQVVELRFFGGLNEADTAQAMQTSLRSVQRMWADARGRLLADMEGNV